MAPWEKCRYRVGREALGRCAGRKNNYLSHGAIVCGEKQSFLHHEIKQSWGLSSYPSPLAVLQFTALSFVYLHHHGTSSCCSGLSHFFTIHYHLSIICLARQAYTWNTEAQARSVMKKKQNRTQNVQMNASSLECNMKHVVQPPLIWRRLTYCI